MHSYIHSITTTHIPSQHTCTRAHTHTHDRYRDTQNKDTRNGTRIQRHVRSRRQACSDPPPTTHSCTQVKTQTHRHMQTSPQSGTETPKWDHTKRVCECARERERATQKRIITHCCPSCFRKALLVDHNNSNATQTNNTHTSRTPLWVHMA